VQFVSNGCYIHPHSGSVTFKVEIMDSQGSYSGWRTVHMRHSMHGDNYLDWSFNTQATTADRIRISDNGQNVNQAFHSCGSEQVRIFGQAGKAKLEYKELGADWQLLQNIESPGMIGNNFGVLTLPKATHIEKLRITIEDGATVSNCGASQTGFKIKGFRASSVNTFHGCDTGVEASFNRDVLPDVTKSLSTIPNNFDLFEADLENVGAVRSMQFLGHCAFPQTGHFQVSVKGPNAWHVVMTKHVNTGYHDLQNLGVIDMTAYNRPVHKVKIESFKKSSNNDRYFSNCKGLQIRFNPRPSEFDLTSRQNKLAQPWTMPADFPASFTQTTSILAAAVEATKLRFDWGCTMTTQPFNGYSGTATAMVTLSTYSRSTGQWLPVRVQHVHPGQTLDQAFGEVTFGLHTVFGVRLTPDPATAVALKKQNRKLFSGCAGLNVQFN